MDYIKINGRWLTEYDTILGKDGKNYFVNLRFTPDFSEAKVVPLADITRLLLSARKVLTRNGECTFVYELNHTGNSTPVMTTPSPGVVKRYPTNDPTVTIDTVGLQEYMLRKGLSNRQLAIDMGYTGKNIHYGSKIAKGTLKPRVSHIVALSKKHPYFKKYL